MTYQSEYERLRPEIEKEFQKIKKNIQKYKYLTVKELLEMKLPKNLFLVEKLVPDQGITVISGHPGNCKSWILLHIIHCIEKKYPVFGKFNTKKGKTLLIDEESGKAEMSRRIKMLKLRKNSKICLYIQNGIKVDNKKDLEEIISLIKNENIKLVVLDPFIAIHDKPENSAEEIQKVMNALQKITLSGATVLFAHHNRKDYDQKNPFFSSQNMRGSSAILGRVDSQIEIKKIKTIENETILTITHNKIRTGIPVKPFKIKMVEEDKSIYFDYIGESIEDLSKREKIRIHVLKALKEKNELDFNGLFNEKIAGRDLFKSVLLTMKKEEEIKSFKKERGKEFFSILNDHSDS
jgi:RecA-family ATPase